MIAIAIAAVCLGVIVALKMDDAERERRHTERMPTRFRVEPWGITDDGDWRWPK